MLEVDSLVSLAQKSEGIKIGIDDDLDCDKMTNFIRICHRPDFCSYIFSCHLDLIIQLLPHLDFFCSVIVTESKTCVAQNLFRSRETTSAIQWKKSSLEENESVCYSNLMSQQKNNFDNSIGELLLDENKTVCYSNLISQQEIISAI